MGVTNIYLARHGQTEYNRKKKIQGRGIDASLNGIGKEQARAIAADLQGITLHRIVSSSLKRSRQSASIVAKEFDLQVASYKELDEMDFGVFEGQPISEVQTELEAIHERWKAGEVDYTTESGESPKQVFERADKRARRIIEQHQNLNILFVLHGRLLRILLSDWLAYGLAQMYKIPHANGALYHLQWNGSDFKSVYLNKTDHLPSFMHEQGVTS